MAVHVSIHSIFAAASIDLKKEEVGILTFCEKYAIPFDVYTKEELMNLEGDFTASEFVKETTGVDCVCERSASLAGGGAELLLKKRAANGLTVALALKDWSVDFG